MNSLTIPRPAGAPTGRAVAIVASTLALALSLSACSAIFRSSIQGRVIDLEAWDDGTTTGVVEAKVFLYTDKAARDADYLAYVEGSESTLPDGLPEQKYFQSTVTDADGAYDFTGFIWESLFPKYGKTADRYEIFLLVYHPDYGLWKNPVPLYVVSDVTNQLDYLKIENLWNEGRLAGRVLNWKDGKGLGGVSVNFYVAESWSYDAAGNFSDAVYPSAPTATATADEDGRWAATVRFPMKPTRAVHAAYNKAPVRVAFVRENYRANDPADGTGLANAGLVTSVDIDRDGLTPAQEDYGEAFVESTLSYDATKGEAALGSVADVTLQRWRFTATVRGRVSDGGAPATRVYYNGIEVLLAAPAPGGTEYRDVSGAQTVGETTTDGHFNIGTVTWRISDVADLTGDDGNVAGVTDEQKSGRIKIGIKADGTAVPPARGGKDRLSPDVAMTLELDIVP